MTRPETIIVVTNYPSDDYRTASRECGADHFFDKASEFPPEVAAIAARAQQSG